MSRMTRPPFANLGELLTGSAASSQPPCLVHHPVRRRSAIDSAPHPGDKLYELVEQCTLVGETRGSPESYLALEIGFGLGTILES